MSPPWMTQGKLYTTARRKGAIQVRDHRGKRAREEIEAQGQLLVWKAKRKWTMVGQRSTRGQVTGFSRMARFRMLKLIATIQWGKVGKSVFITLTLPDEIEVKTAKQITDWRSRFWKRLENFVGREVAAIWRVEWKERRTGKHVGKLYPHFHLLVMGVPFIDKGIIREWWKEVIGWNEHVHTHVRGMETSEHAAKYTAKYAAKVDPGSLVSTSYLDRPIGRQWGTLRKKLIPQFEVQLFNITMNEKTRKIKSRALDGRPAICNPEDASFTLLGPRTVEIIDALRELGIDDIDLPG